MASIEPQLNTPSASSTEGTMDQHPAPSAPPPAYGSTTGDYPQAYPQPGQQATASGYTDPPPVYEPPKQNAGQQQYPPPPPPGGQNYPYQQQPQGYQGATVYPGVVHQTVIVSQPGYGPLPKTIECPNCHASVNTTLTYQSGGLTWLAAGMLCLFGCWMGCCLIPFCIDDLSDVQHRCPNCGKHVATYHRL